MALSKVENPFTGQIIPVEFAGDEPTQQELESLYNFLNQSNEQSNTPLTKEEFIDKRRYDQTKSTFQTVAEFGEGIIEGAGEIVKQGGEALDELPPGYQMILAPNYEKFFDAIGDIVDLGGRDFVRFAKTLGGAAMDKLGGYTEEEEIDREYKRYIENFDYHTKVRPAMLASDEIEFKKIANFGANFVDPFLAFPVAKLGTMAVRAPLVALQKGATKGAYATRSKGLVGTSRFLQKTGKAVGGVDKGVEIIGKIGAYPSEMAARAGAYATRKAIKGSALGAGLALQGIGKLGAGVEKVASAPRKAVTALAGKLRNIGEGAPSAAALSGQVTGAISGVPGFLEAGIAEGIGILAKKVGGGAGQVLRILAEPASNKRFLYRVATSEKVSPQMRKAAMFAYSNYGTSMGDGAFNMLANGLSIGAINSALAGLAGEDARTAGAGFGAGAVIGGALPFGQRGMRAGKRDVARDDKSIDSHMANKLTSLQRESFLKLPKPAQVMLATLEEAGVGAPKVMIVEPKLYLEMLNKDRVEKGMEPLTRAPKGHFQKADRTIFINEKFLPRGSKEATEIAAHEVGHDFIYQALGEDPGMLELILDKYKTTADKGTPYYFKFGPSRKATAEDVANGVATREGQVIPGEPIGDPIYLSDEAVQIGTDYDRIQRGISVGRDAGKLAQEIGADQFAMMFSKDPNAFNNFHPRLRRHLIDSARKVLASIGVVKPDTGNPLSNPISKTMLKNPSIQRLFDNYGKARGIELDEKANLANDSVTIKPKKGQSGEDRYTELFGGQGLSLRDARNLIVSNKSLIRQVKSIMKMYKDEPRDTWSVTKNGKFTGKNLLQDLRTIFTRNDPFGNVANILDALQEAINQRIGVRFGYRSGTKGKYQNPFKIRDVALYAWEVSGFGGGRPSLKVLGYNQAVVRSNIQVLVEKGYIKDPDKFMLDLEKQGQRALEDPEGRINPEGRDENVLMTVAFGLKESAPNIKSEGLRDLLESKVVKKSFVSYDVEALAGLTKGKDKAFAFNYSNIRDNYNPFRQSSEPLFRTDNNLYSPEPNRKDKSNAQVQGQKGIRGVSAEEVRQYGYRTNPATRGDDFREGIQRVYDEHPVGKAVEVKSLDFYKDPQTGLFLSEDSLAGMAVTPDADLVSVFKHPDSNANVKEMLGEASEYAKTLDAYDVNGFLPNLYSQFGFKPVARVKFNREFAPDGWPYDKLGEPDIVLMVKDPENNIAPVKMDVQGFDKVREQVPVMDGMDAWDYAAQFGEKAKAKSLDDDKMFMPALEDAKALVEQRGRVAEAAEETFFGKMMPKILRKVGGQLKPSTRNIREAARRAIEDTEVFLKENPQFADYYNKDMEKVRALLDDAYNGIIDDEMLYYRLTLGLTSPGTSLPANVGDGLNIFNLKKQDGNLDKIKLGESAKGNVVIADSPFEISGTTAPTKARALKIVDRLEKEKGGIRQAVEFLEEAIPMNELHKFKQEMGYKGKVGKPGDVKRIVKSATGQDKLIPRMFIFGPKVGAYTLNAIGRHNYNTIDVWEARFIRSYFKGMFSKNTGLPANVDEHALMTRFTEMFQEEYNRMTGQNLETSALQALRWFYMIDTAKKLGYTGASTNETISGYTERYITRLGLDQGSGGQSNATTDGGVSAQPGPTEQQFLPQPRQLNRVTSRPASPQTSNRFMMMPAAARAAVASGQTLERFRN